MRGFNFLDGHQAANISFSSFVSVQLFIALDFRPIKSLILKFNSNVILNCHMHYRLILILSLIVKILTECTSEVFTVLAGYPVTYSSRWEAHDCQIFRLDVRDNAWSAQINDKQQWVQISSLNPELWVGVVTQGRGNADQWIEEYMVSYTMDGREWTFVERGRRFDGNYDRNTWVRNDFSQPIFARSIRIHPTKWFNFVSMRFDAIFERI